MRLLPEHPGRRRMAARIARLDPERDAAEIYRLAAMFELPFELRYGLNLAFYRTFAIPRIAAVLARTGEMERNPMKRAYDTGLFIYELIEAGGLDTERGRMIVAGLNRAHRGWGIPNDDFVYVLAAFVVVPTRWVDQFGWRRFTEHERDATVAFYQALGRRMAIKDIPGSYADFERLLDEYEAQYLTPSAAGLRLMAATTAIIAERLPHRLRFAAPLLTSAIADDALCCGLGLAPAGRFTKTIVRLALRARAVIVRRMPPRTASWFTPGAPISSVYPRGYALTDLGPDAKVDRAIPTPPETQIE